MCTKWFLTFWAAPPFCNCGIPNGPLVNYEVLHRTCDILDHIGHKTSSYPNLKENRYLIYVYLSTLMMSLMPTDKWYGMYQLDNCRMNMDFKAIPFENAMGVSWDNQFHFECYHPDVIKCQDVVNPIQRCGSSS